MQCQGQVLSSCSVRLSPCGVEVRLRGIGSGFLEGSDGTEAVGPAATVLQKSQANMPLQLNVSCTDYTDYVHLSELMLTFLRCAR